MEMESSTWVVDTSLDLNTNPYFKILHEDHHKKEDVATLQGMKESSIVNEESGVLVKELKRISSENQKLTEMLTCMCDKYNVLQTHFLELKDKNSTISMKRKADNDDYGHTLSPFPVNGVAESSSSDEETNNKRPKQETSKGQVSRVLVRNDASNPSLVVKDGYQWRKYGQKVTRDNPSPRAYYKCSFAPSCPVKKKVQRSVENPSVLVATYEGQHNHLQPCRAELMLSSTQDSATNIITSFIAQSSSPSNDNYLVQPVQNAKKLVQQETNNTNNQQAPKPSQQVFQKFLVQQMATSLTKDPNFTAALAAAISGKILDQTSTI